MYDFNGTKWPACNTVPLACFVAIQLKCVPLYHNKVWPNHTHTHTHMADCVKCTDKQYRLFVPRPIASVRSVVMLVTDLSRVALRVW